MAGKENTRGISSLPQELYDEVNLFCLCLVTVTR